MVAAGVRRRRRAGVIGSGGGGRLLHDDGLGSVLLLLFLLLVGLLPDLVLLPRKLRRFLQQYEELETYKRPCAASAEAAENPTAVAITQAVSNA